MTLPDDIFLPPTAKYISYSSNIPYNSNYDIIWSFKYNISGIEPEYGICTFLTCVTGLESDTVPGQYMCCTASNSAIYTPPVTILSGDFVSTYYPYYLVGVTIDTTGLCALSSNYRTGVDFNSISSRSLVIRDIANKVIFYQPLSSINYSDPIDTNQIIRCIYSNSNKSIQVDYRNENNLEFTSLGTADLDYIIINDSNLDLVYPGISFCAPISGFKDPCTLQLYNMHHEGVYNNTEVEVLTSDFIS